MKIDSDVLDILSRSSVDGNTLFLPLVQLDRNLYVKVNKCLELIGGKWNRKAKGHIFDSDPSDLLDEMINTGEVVDTKKEYQFFATPKEIVQQMIEKLNIQENEIVLEPEAGEGAILECLPNGNVYLAYELNPKSCDKLREKGFAVNNNDFLATEPLPVDVVIMNPPFSKQQDIDHIIHAWEFVKPGGRLASIVSASPFFRENKKSAEFRSWLKSIGAEVISIPEGAFKESGTNVRTKMVICHKN